ncbi:hypothetical protein, conserved [Leishmania tarentolae]|uniref:Uncharacterized protein n=1 Tax=Leishmania tarentolae TaxID=5689 RepID=A0A640KVB4_LEITA|nr:hypothetical protein, conserved [Leishmania tarentolae]
MEQVPCPIVAGITDSRGTVGCRISPIASADCSRLEHRLTQALQLADTICSTQSIDSSTPAGSPGDGGDGLTVVTSASHPPTIDLALTLSHSPGSDQTASGAHGDLFGSPNGSSAAAMHQRLLRAKDSEISHLRRTVQELSSQLHKALTTLDQREDTSAELQDLKRTCKTEAERREKEMQHARLEMLESRVKYRTLEENLAETYKADVQAKAMELLEPRTKEVYDKNFDLLKEKMMLAQEVTTLRTRNKDLQEKYMLLKRETDLDGSATREMLQRSVFQKDEIASLRLQVKTTEDNLNRVVAEYEEKLRAERKVHEKAVQSLTRERDAARRDALQLQRQLVELRRGAANVLAQRSELETFFHAALEEVRQGALQERRQLLLENTAKGSCVNADQAPTVQTISSVLRLEAPERLMLTNSESPALLKLSSPAGWTVDRKGFPKRIAAPVSKKARPPVGIAPLSSSSARRPETLGNTAPENLKALPNDDSATGNRTLLTLPDATPSYMHSNGHEVPLLLAKATDRCTAVATLSVESRLCSSSCEDGAPFRLGQATVQNRDVGPSPAPAAERGALNTDQMGDFSLLRSLPTAPTWQDVKRVDVSELRWVDKERVIQLLFKRIRQEGRQHARMLQQASSKGDSLAKKVDVIAPVEALPLNATELGRDSLTFLTQQ